MNKSAFSFALIIVTVMTLSACNTVPTGTQLIADGKTALATSIICCTDLSQATFIPLPVEKVKQSLDAKSQSMIFEGQKSFFVIYSLPRFEKPYSIVVSSFPSGNASDASLFLPRISLHGAKYELKREFDDKSLRNRGNSLERTIFINPENRDEQYLLIRASDLNAKIERNVSIVTANPVYVAPGVTAYYHTGADGKVVIQSSPVGRLEIEVQGLIEKTDAKK
jgi:hypothetical protein